jgi:5-methylcytosine-specific restriction endonuclease McrA
MKEYFLKQYNTEELENLLRQSNSMWDFCRKIGYTNKSGSTYYNIRKHLSRRGINLDQYSFIRINKGKTKRKSDTEVFCENSGHRNTDIKKRIISKKLLDLKCSECGIVEWNNKPISLQLDHINGINDDNRIENLRFLCPNCHSQTDTWGTKNWKNKKF